jgi:hypothetical protein
VAKIAKHLQYLVGYPHGCIEQTTSQLFAMLLLKPTLGPDVLSTVLKARTLDNIDTFLEAGVQKLSRMQMEDGGFAFWLGGSTQYPWLNAYATHFLWKARQLGYAIPDAMYSKALQKLQSQFTGSQASGEPDVLAYSAFVLALHGQVSKADLQWLVSRLQEPARGKENTNLRPWRMRWRAGLCCSCTNLRGPCSPCVVYLRSRWICHPPSGGARITFCPVKPPLRRSCTPGLWPMTPVWGHRCSCC